MLGAVATGLLLASFGALETTGKREVENIKSHTPTSVAGASEITCTFTQIMYARFFNGQITHGLPLPEQSPLVFTFSDFNENDLAKLKYIDSTRTISEALVMKIHEDDEKIVFIEGAGDPYVTTHTIFKDTGIAIFTKGVSLVGTPSGSLAAGTCVGY